jgi:hypothetical protein
MKGSRVVEAWIEFKKSIDKEPFLVLILVNKACFVTTLVDTRYSSYRLIDSYFTTKHNLQCIPIYLQGVTGYNALSGDKITKVAIISIDINRHSKERAFAYIVPRLALYDMILGIV